MVWILGRWQKELSAQNLREDSWQQTNNGVFCYSWPSTDVYCLGLTDFDVKLRLLGFFRYLQCLPSHREGRAELRAMQFDLSLWGRLLDLPDIFVLFFDKTQLMYAPCGLYPTPAYLRARPPPSLHSVPTLTKEDSRFLRATRMTDVAWVLKRHLLQPLMIRLMILKVLRSYDWPRLACDST